MVKDIKGSLNLNEQEMKDLLYLNKKLNSRALADVLKESLRLMKYLVEEKEKGSKVFVGKPQGMMQEVVIKCQ